MFEVEKRGILTKRGYDKLLSFLKKYGKSLGDDDKYVVYYIYSDKLLKAVDNASKGNAKISLKMNKIGNGSVFPETEIFFHREDFTKIKFILDTIVTPEKVMTGVQKRQNFIYKDCEFAIKWSKYWGYHFEIEKVVNDETQIQQANEDLENIAKELNIEIMSDGELKIFTKKAEEVILNSLRDLLMGKNKPKHQYNDKESVEWIKINQPVFDISKSEIVKISTIIEKIINISPWDFFKDEFYVNNQVHKGVHGKNHAIRVSIYILLLYLRRKDMGNIEINDLILCALFHDCSRINDNSDEGHGERSANLFQEYARKNKWKLKDLDGVMSAIHFHDLKYNDILHQENYIKHKNICDLLKSADSLDRYRFQKINWWLKNEYLNIIPTDAVKKFAFMLTSNTELECAEGIDINYKKNLENLKLLIFTKDSKNKNQRFG